MKSRARKLAKKWTGPFNIIQQASLQVIVLHHLKGHDFKLNMECVKLFCEKRNTKEERSQPAPASMDEEYKIKAIIDHCDQNNGQE